VTDADRLTRIEDAVVDLICHLGRQQTTTLHDATQAELRLPLFTAAIEKERS